MPASVYHAFTNAIADGPNTNIVRPSNWNSAHLVSLSPSGQEIIGAFSNNNFVSFATNTDGKVEGSVFTNYAASDHTHSQYLTTAAASDHTHSQYLTTAAASDHTHSQYINTSVSSNFLQTGYTTHTHDYAATNHTHSQYLTTARASNDAIGLNTALTGNGVSVTANSSGLSINVPAFLTTAAASDHTHSQYLTTAAQSNHSHNFATTTTNGASIIVGTTNSNGVTIGVPPFLTTAAATNVTTNNMATSERNNYFYTSNNTFANSTHSHGNPTLALTNLSGTTASASNGLTISLSAGAGGGGAGTNTGLNLTNLTGTLSANTNGISLSLSANNPGGGVSPKQYWACPPWANNSHNLLTNITAIDKRAFFMPFNNMGDLSCHEVMFPMSKVTSNQDAVFTIQAGVFSYVNSSSIASVSSTQNVFSIASSVADARSIRLWEVIFSNTYVSLTPGQYVIGLWFSANGGATSGMNFSLMGNATTNQPFGVVHPGTNATFTHTTHQAIPLFGRHTVTSAGLPGDIAGSDMWGQASALSHSSHYPIAMNWTIGTHN